MLQGYEQVLRPQWTERPAKRNPDKYDLTQTWDGITDGKEEATQLYADSMLHGNGWAAPSLMGGRPRETQKCVI